MKTIHIKTCFFLFISLSFFMCSAPKKPADDLEKTILEMIKAFEEKNEEKIHSFVSKEKGLTILHRMGAFDVISETDSVDFNNPYMEYALNFELLPEDVVAFESLPTFDYAYMKWSKTGIFCDTTKTNHLLSTTAKRLNEYEMSNYSESHIQAFEQLEKDSHRVVLCNNKGGELIFYLTQIQEKWFLTIIDKVTTDISA